jgi:hypothetical protein
MLTHQGFSAWITVDDHPLPVYLTAVEGNQISCWIAATPGRVRMTPHSHFSLHRFNPIQNFAVHWRDNGSKIDTMAYIHLDGQAIVPGRFLFGSGETKRDGMRTSSTTQRPFMFQSGPEQYGTFFFQQIHTAGPGKRTRRNPNFQRERKRLNCEGCLPFEKRVASRTLPRMLSVGKRPPCFLGPRLRCSSSIIHAKIILSASSSTVNKDAGTILLKIKRIKRGALRSPNQFRSLPDGSGTNRPGEAYVGQVSLFSLYIDA